MSTVDEVKWEMSGQGCFHWPKDGEQWAGLTSQQYSWLAGVSERNPGRPVILVMHETLYPLPPALTGLDEPIHPPKDPYVDQLRDFVSEHPQIKRVLAGYCHASCRTDRDAIMASIDRGVPVVAMDLEDGMDWGVIAGYADGGKVILCRTYKAVRSTAREDNYLPHRKWPWLVCVIGEKVRQPDRKENLVRSLKRAVELANTKAYGEYASGFAAYDAWIADLLDDARFDKLSRKEVDDMAHPNFWPYYSLYDARASASRYLRSIVPEFSGHATAHISAAAKLYQQITDVLRDGLKFVPMEHALRGQRHWTNDLRHKQAEVMKNALALERKAIREIEQVLEALSK